MDNQRWLTIKNLFEKALDQAPSERQHFLIQACGDDTELLQLVEAMLEADVNPPTLLEAAPEQLSTVLNEDSVSPPAFIGPYRVLRLLGQGGMGLVVQAERTDLPKQVAIKLIRDRWATPQALNRFRQEQAILARMEHPHIAHLLDAGTTDDGIPYLAMEFVDGESITAYADGKHLSIEQRLHLFEDVCVAVQFAHRNLVIHRDLKPSNILVGESGQVKLLDFGGGKTPRRKTLPLHPDPDRYACPDTRLCLARTNPGPGSDHINRCV